MTVGGVPVDGGNDLYHTLRPTMHAKDDRTRLDAAPSPHRAADWVGEAVFNGHVAVWSWPVEDVQRILARGLELVPPPFGPALALGHHPVLFAHGEQTRGTNFFAGIPLRSGLAYREGGFFVPFVRRRGGCSLSTAVPAMYADFFPPVWHGEAHYGYGKQLVELCDEGPVQACLATDGRVLLELVAEPRGPWRSGPFDGDAVTSFIVAATSLPIVGWTSEGTFIGSSFQWDFSHALVRYADSSVELHPGLIHGAGRRTCDDLSPGTVEVRGMSWRLGWPERLDR